METTKCWYGLFERRRGKSRWTEMTPHAEVEIIRSPGEREHPHQRPLTSRAPHELDSKCQQPMEIMKGASTIHSS